MEEKSTLYYDDPGFSYPAFWHGREYEHLAELMALRTLLGARRFMAAVDIGGGFGRLATFLSNYARAVTLIEPSGVQRSLAMRLAASNIKILKGSASHTGLPEASCDLAVMVRVMHHIPSPKESIAEVRRILKPGGLFVLEFANSQHAKSRLRRGMKLEHASFMPVEVNGTNENEVPFVNHHPQAMYSTLIHQGFVIEQILSVSNVRSPLLKRLLPLRILVWIEALTQRLLSHLHFGPSIFVLTRKP
ncbi:MAG: class I SAM-dependent methyltransferase [Patescibacteria group bacterium]|nr:class I SAM-dependent methyltransferase [Patescibacteria group bacterium]